MTILTALGSPSPNLTKTIINTDIGFRKQGYSNAYRFDAEIAHDVGNIDDLAAILAMLEGQPSSCVIRGEPISETTNIRRALRDDPAQGPASIRPVANGLPWLMLDLDKVPVASVNLPDDAARLNHLIEMLPPAFHEASFYYQWSSSAGLDGWTTLSAHLWFWLDQPWLCRDLYERFATGDWRQHGVDPAPFTPNQIHYTAAPIFVGTDDPLAGRRSGLVRKRHDKASLPAFVRPLTPPPALSPREHHQLFPGIGFEALLAEIGPGYHAEVRRAVAHYVVVSSPAEYDRGYLIDRITDAIATATPGKNAKSDYTCAVYLNRLIDGAERKFRGVF